MAKTKIIHCEYCGTPKEVRKDSPTRFCSISCSRKIRKGSATGNERLSSGGYIEVYMPSHPRARKNGYIFKHILVMEETLGRLVDPSEEVHHKDENKLNNVPENLEILSKSDHAKKTAQARREKNMIPCGYCGEMTYKKPSAVKRKGRGGRVFCSLSCVGKWTYENKKGVFKK
jgi:hypothetical protein